MRVTFKESILMSVFLLSLFVIYLAFQLTPKNYLQVSFLNVGQGDSILFQTPSGGKILIDGGKDKSVLTSLGLELLVFEKQIELVIATHDDADHIGGLIEVLKRYRVDVLLYPLPNSTNPLSQELIKIAKSKNTKIVQIKTQMIIKTEDGLMVKILFPVSDVEKNGEVISNDVSIASQFIFGNNKFLLTGDLGISGELYLVNKYGDNLKSDVLKLGHHGSDTSTHAQFLQKVLPSVSVASVGKNNPFGHPHKSVLDLLEKFRIPVLRTDESGTITFYSNGLNVWR